MSYFSIEDAVKQIKNSYTQKLFKEVYSSFSMENYRSAVVMLWSVVVTDLILKLQELENVYGDSKATLILNEIKRLQIKEPRSPRWERGIIDDFRVKLTFFSEHEADQMKYLQSVRHISAHPVINDNDMLHSPSRSEVYSLMQLALDAVLTKNALFSSSLTESIYEDISKINDILFTDKDKEDYFCKKFLNNMSAPALKKFINMLWKYSFKLRGEDHDYDRNNNIVFLGIILRNRKDIFFDYVREAKGRISSYDPDPELIKALLKFMVYNKEILPLFEVEFKDQIYALLNNKEYKYYEYILFNTPVEYCEHLESTVYGYAANHSMRALRGDCIKENIYDRYISICIGGYINAHSYDNADSRFKRFLMPELNNLSVEQLKFLVKEADGNSQAYGRSNSLTDHRLVLNIIKEKISDFGDDFDILSYRNFTRGNVDLFIPQNSESVEQVDDMLTDTEDDF